MSSSLNSSEQGGVGRRKRSELLQYYDASGNATTETPPSLDLHTGTFDARLYAQKLIKVLFTFIYLIFKCLQSQEKYSTQKLYLQKLSVSAMV